MTEQELTLAQKLEIFAREQASRYGEVISYVTTPTPIPEVKKGTESIVAEPVKVATADEASVVRHHGFDELAEKLQIFQGEAWSTAASLDELEALIKDCHKCRLFETRTKLVFGKGNPNAKVMVIGEAPGSDEDKSGEPFIGRAGQLLTKMLQAIQFEREDVFITNILKSRPPNNRDPKPDEVEACEPYLWKQILTIRPKMILCMGRVAAVSLLKGKETALGKLRGNVYDFYGVKVMATYHPAALLRNPDWKRPAWEDLQQFRDLYDKLD
jgi:uracil-DNA glycosylase